MQSPRIPTVCACFSRELAESLGTIALMQSVRVHEGMNERVVDST